MKTARVKICGLTRATDVRAAVDAGAYAVGFVFAPSKRRVAASRAQELVAAAPGGIVRVGVFMNQQAAEIESILAQVPLDMLQFHGGESNGFCRAFGMPFLKAVAMRAGARSVEPEEYPDAEGLLFDTHGVGGAGGTGMAFDWALIPECPQRTWLAGGLHPGNVAEAIQCAGPFAVDVSSGVEDAPGLKSGELIRAFVLAAAGGKEIGET